MSLKRLVSSSKHSAQHGLSRPAVDFLNPLHFHLWSQLEPTERKRWISPWTVRHSRTKEGQQFVSPWQVLDFFKLKDSVGCLTTESQ